MAALVEVLITNILLPVQVLLGKAMLEVRPQD
jgi:hypothetical protein